MNNKLLHRFQRGKEGGEGRRPIERIRVVAFAEFRRAIEFVARGLVQSEIAAFFNAIYRRVKTIFA